MKEQTILLKDLFPLSAEHLTMTSVFIKHLFYNSGGTSNQDQATREENNPAPYKETKSTGNLKGFLRPHRIFFCFFSFPVETQKSTQVDGKVSHEYLV